MRYRKTDVIIECEIKTLTRKIKNEKKFLKDLNNNTILPENTKLEMADLSNRNINDMKKKIDTLQAFKIPFDTIPSSMAEVFIEMALNNFSIEAFRDIMCWDVIHKSPYSNSFYNSHNISWGYKPINSLRVSDHWNFGANKEHCKTDIEIYDELALGKFDGEKYVILKKY